MVDKYHQDLYNNAVWLVHYQLLHMQQPEQRKPQTSRTSSTKFPSEIGGFREKQSGYIIVVYIF